MPVPWWDPWVGLTSPIPHGSILSGLVIPITIKPFILQIAAWILRTITIKAPPYNMYTGQTDKARFGLPEIQWSGNPYFLGGSWPKTVGPDSVTQFSDS